ncbi:hypothetical protein JCM6882_001437 [Rhodosporidiobolus microsporus]
MAPSQLVASDSDSDHSDADDNQLLSFKVNEQFATKYDTKKRTEELSKLQDKYGKDYQFDDDDDDSEDLSSDDEDAEFVTPSVDAAILATLAKIRAKDPAVYDNGRNVFDEEEARTTSFSSTKSRSKPSGSSSSKPVLLKDFQRARLLANPTDDDSLDALSGGGVEPTPVQEQAALKREIKAAFAAAGGESDDEDEGDDEDEDGGEDGGLFKRREKGDDERAREEREYERFLETAVGKKAVKEALGDEEAFLRDYILNRGWIDREADAGHIPSYDEIVGDSEPSSKKKKKGKSKLLLDDDEEDKLANVGAHDDEDEEYEERADEYETKYNFRFEQAGAADLVTHARDSLASVRKPTAAVSARARAREAAKERKEEEKLQRKEEVRRLKALKRKEVEEKLLQLVEAGGAKEGALEGIDLEGEWDEAAHEEAMRKVYGEEYEGMDDDGFKPTWDDDIDITDLVGSDGEVDDDEVMQYLPVASTSALPTLDEDDEEDGDDVPMGKKSKKSKKAKKDKSGDGGKKRKRDEEGFPTELLEAAKAGGDAEREQLLDRMVDEYYALDYEDKVGDVKTRFKYAKVAPSSFALSAEEILLATDAELNAFMSLKKLAPYRQDSPAWLKKEHDKQRKKVKELRDALRNRKWGEEVDEDLAERLLEERKEKKKRYRAKDKEGKEDGGEKRAAKEEGGDGEPPKKKKRAGKSERKRLAKEAAEAGGAATE